MVKMVAWLGSFGRCVWFSLRGAISVKLLPLTSLVCGCLAAGVVLMGTVSSAADDAVADVLARIILAKAGIRAGVCELPRVGDGTLAAALARQGAAQVHAGEDAAAGGRR